MKKIVLSILVLVMALTCLTAVPITAMAADTEVNYTLGEEYNSGQYSGNKFFNFKLTTRSHLYVTFNSSRKDYWQLSIYDTAGNCLSDKSNTRITSNSLGDTHYFEHSCNLDAGSYRICVYSGSSSSNHLIQEFVATAEPVVSLGVPSITSISCPAAGSLKVGYSAVTNALTYQIQYSTNTSFTSAGIKEFPGTSYTVSGLKKGVYYYARVRAYTVYNDGLKVYGNWSRAQSVFVKKLTNTVTISTSKKTLKYKDLKKKNKSFNVIANDVANASFTFSLSKVPSKLKKKISIDKTTGRIKVKKGTKKGTYKVTVKVSAAATADYNAASATKTITIVVK